MQNYKFLGFSFMRKKFSFLSYFQVKTPLGKLLKKLYLNVKL